MNPRKHQGKGRYPCASFLMSAIAVYIYMTPGAAELFEYDQQAILNGEFWRFITGHFTHFTASHLFWDLFTFFVLSSFCERFGPGNFMRSILVAACLISASLWCLDPSLRIYRGLSGLCSTVYILAALIFLKGGKKTGHRLRVTAAHLFIVLFIAKTLFELGLESTVFVSSLGPAAVPVPLSHIAGAFAGFAIFHAGEFKLPEARWKKIRDLIRGRACRSWKSGL